MAMKADLRVTEGSVTTATGRSLTDILTLFRCPETGAALLLEGGRLRTRARDRDYAISPSGIPLFAERFCSQEARLQQVHYEAIAQTYVENLTYPHTQEYTAYLDRALFNALESGRLGVAAEICCGRAEAFRLLHARIDRGIGVDISLSMLETAQDGCPAPQLAFVQGDATRLPLASNAFDSVLMLGGI